MSTEKELSLAKGEVGDEIVREFEISSAAGGSDSKESACNAEDLGSTPGSGSSAEEGNVYTLLYSCLENSMDREAWGL